MKDTFIIGGSYKQSSGYISTIIGSFKENDEIIYVATTNRPDCPFMCYWDNGNCYFYKKDDNSTNYIIRTINKIKIKED